jgi:hypothetical protein
MVAVESRAQARGTQQLTEDVVQAYVPDVVGARLAAGQAEWLAELRHITGVFVNLVDVDPAAVGLLEPVQLAMAAIQPILQRYEGSLKQVVVDDKGLTLIAVFGLPCWPTRTIRPVPPGPRSRFKWPLVDWGWGTRSGWPPAGPSAVRWAATCTANTTSSARS